MSKNCKDCDECTCGAQGSDNISENCGPKDYLKCQNLDAGPEGMHCKLKPFMECAAFLNSVGKVREYPPECPFHPGHGVNREGHPMMAFGSGAIREDKIGKGRCDLLPMCAMLRLSRHFQDSLSDHPERNWEKGIPMHSYVDSALRHLMEYADGMTDEDHLVRAAWNIMCAMWTEEKMPEMQDIPAILANKKPGMTTKELGDALARGIMRTHD